MFITFDGGDGVGKTTQIKLLEEFLSKKNIDFITTKEPGGTLVGQEIRKILVNKRAEDVNPIAEAMLYFADRCHHVEFKIKPALKEGKFVISDRFADSTKAYQYYGYNKRVKEEVLDNLYQIAVGDFKPDLTIILDIDPEIGLKRSLREGNTETHFELKEIEFHHNLRNGFLEIAKKEPERCVVVNANDTPENVHKKIVEVICDRAKI
ncbi:MAG: dTMP kinase [Alphaproteobacteria bacterium]